MEKLHYLIFTVSRELWITMLNLGVLIYLLVEMVK
ncbi:putative membrane protein [Estrella lausannensis]|uniref:Putative membrane protein n=1 Tax=Estrella lausannensis TaxID=483423 RepID=A0A0H5E619_9BACT|nr:putative membrane protein [Estrella lausannensis]